MAKRTSSPELIPPSQPPQAAPPRRVMPLWRYWGVEWEFFSRVYGQWPADPEKVRTVLETREPKMRPPGGRSIAEIHEEVMESLAQEDQEAAEQEPKYSYLVFQHHPDDGPIHFRGETIRAHYKDCGRQISTLYMPRVRDTGERAFSTKVTNGLYVARQSYWTTLRRPDGEPVAKPDDEQLRFIHGRGPRGPIDAVKLLQYVGPPTMIRFVIQTLGNAIHGTDLDLLHSYGGVHGYGGERALDGGRYTATFKELNPSEVNNWLKEVSRGKAKR